MQWYVVASVLTILTSSQGIFTTLSQSNGGYKYDYSTVPFLAEVFKVALAIEIRIRDPPLFPIPNGHLQLIVSSMLLWRECQRSPSPKMTTDWRSVRLYPIPSIIYLVHNNVQFATLTYVETSTYQIMGNLKIVTTGILFRCCLVDIKTFILNFKGYVWFLNFRHIYISCSRLFLKRKLSTLQWMAIVLLAIGTTTSQVKGCGQASCNSVFSSPIQGYMLGILSACLSALAGVYTEFLMKKNNDSLYWQNIQLYTFGAIFNLAKLVLDDFRSGFERGAWWQRLFNGYSITTWMVVLNLGSTGLLVSWLMKYADNIVKVYSTSMAMLLTMLLSVFLFNFKPTLQLFLGIFVCIMSLHMYFAPPSVLVDLPLTAKADPESIVEVSVDRRTAS
ncbi:hypothetical protein RD792_015503 [Penstemon davidsonii]|uniref:CMP-sialic acid transporter 1 n=1 Tax=Penstemon davidsonii TaxID=160366 RepID=A0ABR0CHX6_9LAMI|nr:hypothetical protein RD792_015503 [Penstemon davidsonii]